MFFPTAGSVHRCCRPTWASWPGTPREHRGRAFSSTARAKPASMTEQALRPVGRLINSRHSPCTVPKWCRKAGAAPPNNGVRSSAALKVELVPPDSRAACAIESLRPRLARTHVQMPAGLETLHHHLAQRAGPPRPGPRPCVSAARDAEQHEGRPPWNCRRRCAASTGVTEVEDDLALRAGATTSTQLSAATARREGLTIAELGRQLRAAY